MRRDRIFDGQNAYNILNGDCVNDIDMLGERNHRQRILVQRQKKQWQKQIKRMPGAFKGANPGDVVSLAIDTIAYFRDIDSAIDAGVRNCEKIAPTPLIHRRRQTDLSIISDPCRCCVVWMIVAKMGDDKYYFRYLSSSVEDSPCDKLYFMSKNNNSIWRGVPWY